MVTEIHDEFAVEISYEHMLDIGHCLYANCCYDLLQESARQFALQPPAIEAVPAAGVAAAAAASAGVDAKAGNVEGAKPGCVIA